MNPLLATDPVPDGRYPPPAKQVYRLGDGGATRTDRGTPSPNEIGSLFGIIDKYPDLLPSEPTVAVNSPPVVGRDAKYAISLEPAPRPSLYTVNSGNPLASGLFSTDNLDPRPPESSAWKGNHGRVGQGKTGPSLISKMFDDLRLPTGDVMESGHAPPDPGNEKMAFFYKQGCLAALKKLRLWR